MTWNDLPGITLRPLDGALLRVEVRSEVASGRETHVEHAIDAAWEQARAANPRLYDGAMLHVESCDSATGALVVRRERYRRLVAGPAAGVSLRLLAVTGLVIARDARGREHALFGRRGAETRVYPGMWEFGPSGGVEYPAEDAAVIDMSHVRASLIAEGMEELGIDLTSARFCAIALVGDDFAASEDIVLRVDVKEPIDPRRTPCGLNDANAWEYLDTAWVPTDEVGAWVSRSAGAMIPPTVALTRHLGWDRGPSA